MPTPSSRRKKSAPPRPWAVFCREVDVRESDGTRVPVTVGNCPCPDSTWSDHPRNANQLHACKHQTRAWIKAAQLALLGRFVDVVNEISDETTGRVYPVTLPKCGVHGTPFAVEAGKTVWCEHVAAVYGAVPGWIPVPGPESPAAPADNSPTPDPTQATNAA
jgi:hypothetical protein